MILRRSTRIFQTAEGASHDFAPFRRRHDKAKAVGPARKIRAMVGKAHRCRGCIGDLLEFAGRVPCYGFEDCAGVKCRRGEDYAIRRNSLVAGDDDSPAICFLFANQARDRRVRMNHSFR